VNGNGKTTLPVKEEEKKKDIVEEEGSDSEPVFASINQEVEQAKKSRHERKVSSSVGGEEVPKSSNGPTSDPAVPSPEARESRVSEAPPAPVISDSFIDSADATTTDRPQSVLWTSLGRPYPVTEAPGVVFHRRTAVPGRLYPVIKSWESIERPQGKERKVVPRREQVRAVAWRGKRRVKGERVFGEVTPEMIAEIKEQQTPQQQEEAKPAETAIEERLEAPVPQPTVEATPIPRIPSPPAEETATPTATSLEPAPAAEPATAPSSEFAPTPAPAPKAAPKSWAALLRTASKPSSSTPAIAAPSSGSVPSSNITSPRLAASAVVEQVAGTTEGSEQTIVVVPTEGSASAPASTPAQVPAKPANAWGARPMIVPDQLDLGKLLAEGLDERTRASLKKVTSVPRGLINTGNMCFANSVSLSGGLCVQG
jgi:ubiquitin carboxyl-terminal hydrolase 10